MVARRERATWEEQDVCISHGDPNAHLVEEQWTVVGRSGKYDDRSYNVKFACAQAYESLYENHLFSFFRTKITMPINALAHATLDLKSDRNTPVESETNAAIFNHLCDLIDDWAEGSCVSGATSYNVLEILAPKRDFPEGLKWHGFSFEDSYYRKIAAKKIFPTVNQEYISFYDNPKFYTEDFGRFLHGTHVKNLLCQTDATDIQNFLFELAKKTDKKSLEYEYEEFVEAINTSLEDLSLDARAAMWLMFIEKFGKKMKNPVPRFPLDEEGDPVDADTPLFFPPLQGFRKFPDPPKFAKFVFLNRDLLNSLQRLQGGATLDTLYEKLRSFENIKRYEIKDIIWVVRTSIKNKGLS